MKIKEFSVRTRLRAEFVNITPQVQDAVEDMNRTVRVVAAG